MADQLPQLKHDVKKFYDQSGQIYLESTQPPFELRLRYLRKVVSLLPHANRNILELGCGAGVPCTQFLAQHEGMNIIANDISDTQVALARRHLPQSVELLQGDMMELQFTSNKFDAVSAIYTVFHLPRVEQITMLRRIYRWLKLGGGAEGELYWSGWGPEKIREILTEIGFHLQINETKTEMDHGRDGKVEGSYHWILAKKL